MIVRASPRRFSPILFSHHKHGLRIALVSSLSSMPIQCGLPMWTFGANGDLCMSKITEGCVVSYKAPPAMLLLPEASGGMAAMVLLLPEASGCRQHVVDQSCYFAIQSLGSKPSMQILACVTIFILFHVDWTIILTLYVDCMIKLQGFGPFGNWASPCTIMWHIRGHTSSRGDLRLIISAKYADC